MRKSNFTVTVCVIIATVALSVCVFISRSSSETSEEQYSDQNLIDLFRAHRAAFERLRDMAIEDSIVQSYFRASSGINNLSTLRQQEYTNNIKQISSGLIVTVDGHSRVSFIFTTSGTSAIGPGSFKGIEYISESHEKRGVVVENLDNTSLLSTGVYLRIIEPKWFVVYQYLE